MYLYILFLICIFSNTAHAILRAGTAVPRYRCIEALLSIGNLNPEAGSARARLMTRYWRYPFLQRYFANPQALTAFLNYVNQTTRGVQRRSDFLTWLELNANRGERYFRRDSSVPPLRSRDNAQIFNYLERLQLEEYDFDERLLVLRRAASDLELSYNPRSRTAQRALDEIERAHRAIVDLVISKARRLGLDVPEATLVLARDDGRNLPHYQLRLPLRGLDRAAVRHGLAIEQLGQRVNTDIVLDTAVGVDNDRTTSAFLPETSVLRLSVDYLVGHRATRHGDGTLGHEGIHATTINATRRARLLPGSIVFTNPEPSQTVRFLRENDANDWSQLNTRLNAAAHQRTFDRVSQILRDNREEYRESMALEEGVALFYEAEEALHQLNNELPFRNPNWTVQDVVDAEYQLFTGVIARARVAKALLERINTSLVRVIADSQRPETTATLAPVEPGTVGAQVWDRQFIPIANPRNRFDYPIVGVRSQDLNRYYQRASSPATNEVEAFQALMSDTRDRAQELLNQLDGDFFREVVLFLRDIQARRPR